MKPDLTEQARDAAADGVSRLGDLAEDASERAKETAADLSEGLTDAVADATDTDDGTPTWAWFAIGVGALTGVSFAVRAWRRRREVEDPVRRFETLDEGVSYRSSDDLSRWDMPADELDEVTENPDSPSA